MKTTRLLVLLLLVGYASLTAGANDQAKRQVAEATALRAVQHTTAAPVRITSLYDPEAVFWGTQQKRSPQTHRRLLAAMS